ncbi:MAG: acyl-ACP--UDP-N-acetylglucosamine O-acyltransferase [Chromatiales bacterium]|nr:acyl-ACP--UDP-N-acetylglucosamine O-acyltransferase [Chromatiales bacterium]
MIDPSARIAPGASIAESASVGPFTIVGDGVEIGARTTVGPHCVVNGPTRIGSDNKIYQFCSIGDAPQDKKYAGEDTCLEIGDRNVIREYCTFNRGTVQGGGVTRVGSDNWIMAYVHIAHDCIVRNHAIMANGSTLAGHVSVGDHVVFGAFTVVHQFCDIGAHALSAMGTVVLKDVPPYVTVSGNSAQPHGINAEGLRRRNFSAEAIRGIRRAYKTLYKQGLGLEEAKAVLREQQPAVPELAVLVDFLSRSERGIVR